MRLVVDASVAVKWLLPEPLHEEAMGLLELGSSFLAPDLIVAEVANTAWKKVQRGEIDPATAERAAAALCSGFPRLYRSEILSLRALQIALHLRHPVYDCFYLACAEAADAVLVTNDRHLQEIAVQARLGIEVKRLSEFSGPGMLQ